MATGRGSSIKSSVHSIQQNPAVEARFQTGFSLSMAEFPMAECPASLAHCRHFYNFYIMGQTLVTSVGNSSPSGCSQGHDVFTLGLVFSLPFLPLSQEGQHFLRQGCLKDSLRHTCLSLKWGARRQPWFQGQLFSELKSHVAVYLYNVWLHLDGRNRSLLWGRHVSRFYLPWAPCCYGYILFPIYPNMQGFAVHHSPPYIVGRKQKLK